MRDGGLGVCVGGEGLGGLEEDVLPFGGRWGKLGFGLFWGGVVGVAYLRKGRGEEREEMSDEGRSRGRRTGLAACVFLGSEKVLRSWVERRMFC